MSAVDSSVAPMLDRRALLGAACSAPWLLAGLTGCSSNPDHARAAWNPAVIDAHCHVFNASDLPVGGFVQRVVLGDPEHQVVLGPDPRASRAALPYLAALLIQLLSGPAPTAESELAAIERGGMPAPRSIAGRPTETDVERLRSALEAVFDPSAARGASDRAPDGGDLSEEGRVIFARIVADETGIDPAATERRRGAARTDAIARGLLVGDGVISRHVQWARLLTRPRREIIASAVELYGGGAGVTLFTPSLVDYTQWLEDEPRSDIEDQIRVMERIQRLPMGAAVHCFAPYDPWRQIVDEEAGRSPSALELVAWAVREMGFVGVKLYPPMGFLPTGNAEARQNYPARAVAIREFPRKLDAALDRLYGWAAEESVAIMAHTANSNGAAEGYSVRAHPDGWRPVLARYPGLRLNLAHFGGFDERGPDDSLEGTWEVAVGRLISEGRGEVYADVSYLSEVFAESSQDERQRMIAPALKDFVQEYDPDLNHLMYGSDWIMLGREAGHGAYLHRVTALFEDVVREGAELRRFLGGNAARFLGLRPGDAGRARLEAYYAKHHLDPSWLRQYNSPLEA